MPFKFSEKQEILKGSLNLKDMNRLKSMIEIHSENLDLDKVYFQIKGHIDGERRPYLQCKIKTSLPLICQRCLVYFYYPLNTEYNLSPVENEKEASQLPQYYDPLYVDKKGSVVVLEMIEDEIILSLPLVPKHDIENCTINTLNF